MKRSREQTASYAPAKHLFNDPVTPSELPVHKFEVLDPGDHAETPFVAYSHIEPLLFRLALALGKKKSELRIYDPFYCAGSVKVHLGNLGFPMVYNCNEDCYAAWAAGTVPDFDILVTNPPFSGDHIPKTLAFAAKCGKPWFILIPEFCSRKAYYRPTLAIKGSPDASSMGNVGVQGPSSPLISDLCGPIHYLGPQTAAYMFSAPNRGLSGAPLPAKSGVADGGVISGTAGPPRVGHLFAATFQCLWFMALGNSHGPEVLKWWQKKHSASSGCCIADSERALPQLALDPGKKRRVESAARPWRKKLSRQRKAQKKEN